MVAMPTFFASKGINLTYKATHTNNLDPTIVFECVWYCGSYCGCGLKKNIL